ncbi:MAG: NFACT RNA binding domain-containing protein [Candidatus Cloacimonetes bacterium]|nr:NFACT RNA binding domain-containing protein [Candidatus Cloacimonadota bacterium]
MDYATLARWVREAPSDDNPPVAGLLRFEDQALLVFEGRGPALQFHLAAGDCWCFFTQQRELPWRELTGPIADALFKCRLRKVSIADGDRVLFFDFNRVNIYNQREQYRLIVELIPRFSNLILTRLDGDRLVIVDALRRFSLADNPVRQVLPGFEWTPPPPPPRSPATEPPALPLDINAHLESQWYDVELPRRLENLRRQALGRLTKNLKRKQRKLHKQQDELNDAGREEQYRRRAELLKPELHRIGPGQSEAVVTDWFGEGQPQVSIPLLVNLTPKQNMERLFRKARKARSGREKIALQIMRTEKEVDELERDIFEVEKEDDYASLRERVASSGGRGRQRQKRSPYRSLPLAPGWEIFVGRTSRENDQLTTRMGKPHDWWFHSRVFRGSHILLRNYDKQEPPGWMIMLCAQVAAYYSRASKSSNVPVDYTQIRYVRKPRGSAPGFVTYSHQKSLFVDPLSFRGAVQYIQRRQS